MKVAYVILTLTYKRERNNFNAWEKAFLSCWNTRELDWWQTLCSHPSPPLVESFLFVLVIDVICTAYNLGHNLDTLTGAPSPPSLICTLYRHYLYRIQSRPQRQLKKKWFFALYTNIICTAYNPSPQWRLKKKKRVRSGLYTNIICTSYNPGHSLKKSLMHSTEIVKNCTYHFIYQQCSIYLNCYWFPIVVNSITSLVVFQVSILVLFMLVLK